MSRKPTYKTSYFMANFDEFNLVANDYVNQSVTQDEILLIKFLKLLTFP